MMGYDLNYTHKGLGKATVILKNDMSLRNNNKLLHKKSMGVTKNELFCLHFHMRFRYRFCLLTKKDPQCHIDLLSSVYNQQSDKSDKAELSKVKANTPKNHQYFVHVLYQYIEILFSIFPIFLVIFVQYICLRDQDFEDKSNY